MGRFQVKLALFLRKFCCNLEKMKKCKNFDKTRGKKFEEKNWEKITKIQKKKKEIDQF